MTATAAPPVQRLGTAVLLQGPALARLVFLATLGARASERANGLRISSPTRELLAALAAAARASQQQVESPVGHGDVPEHLEPAPSVRVCTREAAGLLSLSARQVRRLGGELDGQLVGGRWTYDQGTVRALAAERDATSRE